MPSFLINDDEREALRGLPMLAREIYVFGLRPFMDYRTGLVGERRGISWKSIAEELYVEPHQGIKGGEPSEKELRRALTWLQKVDLVGPNQAERRLIFQLLKASRDQSARNKVGSKWADEVGSYVGGLEPNNHGPYTEEEGREVGGGESSKVGTPPESGKNPTTPYAHDSLDIPVRFPMSLSWVPGKSFKAVLLHTGLSLNALTDDRLIDFRSYWTATPQEQNTQVQWEHKLAMSVLKQHRYDQARNPHGQATGSEGPAEGQAGRHSASRGLPRRQGPLSAVDRVAANIAANEAARQAAGTSLAEDDGDVRPPLDVEFWRQPESR